MYSWSEFNEDVSNTLNSAWDKTTEWHYENRDADNELKNDENYDTITDKEISKKSGWRIEPRDSCHQNGDGFHDEKYCNKDGREVVFDGKSIQDGSPKIDNNSKTKGTKNYVDPGEKPSADEKGLDQVQGWAEYIARGGGHAAVDVVPWLFLGNTRDDPTDFGDRWNMMLGK